MMVRHVLTMDDLSSDEVREVLSLSADLKSKFNAGIREDLFPRRVMAMLFQKPSLRTRVSFETGIRHLGGASLFLGEDVGWGNRESIEDFSGVLSRYVDLIVVRAKSHDSVVQLADYSQCPVINGLTDLSHPCQALADLLTVQESFGALEGLKIAFVGDANNVSRSLGFTCAKLGVDFALASPTGYEFDAEIWERMQAIPGAGDIVDTRDPAEAVDGAAAVYTDVWASMGQESEQAQREADFSGFQVNASLMQRAKDDAIFLHCLPAHRGLEVSAEVMDGPQSAVLQQAENRLHAQKGLMAWLLNAVS
jgi:ornithine carbamoyltransferase